MIKQRLGAWYLYRLMGWEHVVLRPALEGLVVAEIGFLASSLIGSLATTFVDCVLQLEALYRICLAGLCSLMDEDTICVTSECYECCECWLYRVVRRARAGNRLKCGRN